MYAQNIPWAANYEESEVPPFVLPDPLIRRDGTRISSPDDWMRIRRPELLHLFRSIMYGNPPPLPDETRIRLLSEKKDARGGRAVRREYSLDFQMKDGRVHSAVVLLYVPALRREKVPVCINLTFGGNHAVTDEPDVLMTGLVEGMTNNGTVARGAHARRYPIDRILERGYALAVASYHEFFPDCINGWGKSIYRLFRSAEELRNRPADASAISAWAWGLSRILDSLANFPEIDTGKALCIGHSRLGKTALWAGAQDERFRVVCVNDSGCGGAAPNRRLYGETLFAMYHTGDRFGEWWFSDALKPFAEHPENLPFDQHELIALVAPRRVVVHSATGDLWADPHGEYLSAWAAGPVYRLLGRQPLTSPAQPPPETPAGSDVAYFLRTGAHDLLLPDWEHYLDVADAEFGKI